MAIIQQQQQVEEWQTFYSERAQREYYYNDKIKVVTWILPDNDHPDGKASEQEIVKETRKERGIVTLHTVAEHRGGSKKRKRVRFLSANTFTFVLVVISAIVTFTVWSMQEGGASSQSTSEEPVKSGVQIEPLPAVAAEAIEVPPVEEEQVDRAAQYDFPEQDVSQAALSSPDTEKIGVAEPAVERSEADIEEQERLEPLKRRMRMFGIPQDRRSGDRASLPSEDPPIIEHQTADMLFESDETATEITEDTQTATARTRIVPLVEVKIPTIEQILMHDAETMESGKKSHRGCFVPLMHIFSRKCRTMTNNRPLFDSEEFVNNMIQ